MKKYLSLPIALVFTGVLLVAGCGGGAPQGKGQVTGSTAGGLPAPESVTVQAIASRPGSFDGKVVTTEGNYAVGYCSACFLLKDGVSSVRVEVSDTAPLPPESKLNSRMKVTGKIYVVKDSPNIIADKIEYL